MSDMNEWNQRIIAEFRANDGVVGGDLAGVPLLLLHHTGAKSGLARVNPLAYQRIGNSAPYSPRKVARQRTLTGTTTWSRTRT